MTHADPTNEFHKVRKVDPEIMVAKTIIGWIDQLTLGEIIAIRSVLFARQSDLEAQEKYTLLKGISHE